MSRIPRPAPVVQRTSLRRSLELIHAPRVRPPHYGVLRPFDAPADVGLVDAVERLERSIDCTGPFLETTAIEESALFCRARQTVLAARLDTHITNADIRRACNRRQRAIDFEHAHTVCREKPGGGYVTKPISAWSRSWWSAEGRSHISAEMHRRAAVLIDTAQRSSELPKLLSFTSRGVGVSWTESDRIRGFMSALRKWAKRKGAHISYLWVAEVQRRYELHYHLVVVGLPFLSRDGLRSMWPYGWCDIRAVPTAVALSYVTKYVRKSVSNVGIDDDVRAICYSAARKRRFGASRDISRRVECIPSWLVDLASQNGCGIEEIDYTINTENDAVYTLTLGRWPETYEWSRLKWHVNQTRGDPPQTRPPASLLGFM